MANETQTVSILDLTEQSTMSGLELGLDTL